MDRELNLLKLRSAIADKEWCIACANRETAMDGWISDWGMGFAETQRTIDDLISQFEN